MVRVSGATGHSAAPLGRSGHADNAMKLDLGSARGGRRGNTDGEYWIAERCENKQPISTIFVLINAIRIAEFARGVYEAALWQNKPVGRAVSQTQHLFNGDRFGFFHKNRFLKIFIAPQ